MATKNVTYASLKLKINEPAAKVITIAEKEIEVKQYLPINDKLNLITAVLIGSADDNQFANPVKIDVVTSLELIKAYTNITFTEKQLEDPAKLYDTLETNNVINDIISAIPEVELKQIYDGIEETISAYFAWVNSVKGIMQSMTDSYDETSLDLKKIVESIQDPESMKLLKDVVTKLG